MVTIRHTLCELIEAVMRQATEYLTIRKATTTDVESIMGIIDVARGYMRSRGNATQWPIGSPSVEVVLDHINADALYVGVDATDAPAFVFALRMGEDPTYGYIEGGQWLNDEPYGTIHTVASDGQYFGCMEMILEFCSNKIRNIRIDTHKDNAKMQQIVLGSGFVRCGVIYIADGSPREAFQRC